MLGKLIDLLNGVTYLKIFIYLVCVCAWNVISIICEEPKQQQSRMLLGLLHYLFPHLLRLLRLEIEMNEGFAATCCFQPPALSARIHVDSALAIFNGIMLRRAWLLQHCVILAHTGRCLALRFC